MSDRYRHTIARGRLLDLATGAAFLLILGLQIVPNLFLASSIDPKLVSGLLTLLAIPALLPRTGRLYRETARSLSFALALLCAAP